MKRSCCLLAFLLILTSCSSAITSYREFGRKEIRRSWHMIPITPNIRKEIVLKGVRVVVVGDSSMFGWKKAGVIGYATDSNVIWVIGKEVNGQIVFDQFNLGHELNHLLNFADPKIVNPDDLSDLGL